MYVHTEVFLQQQRQKHHNFATFASLMEKSSRGKWQRTMPAVPFASMTDSSLFKATRRPKVGTLPRHKAKGE